jgi:transposase-like protein
LEFLCLTPPRSSLENQAKEAVVTRNIQFQKGISLAAFQKLYGTEDKCRAALLKDRWPRGFVCPRCGSTRGHALHSRPVVQCGGCRKQTSLTANTLFHSTKLPLTTWFLALYFITQTKTGMSTLELSRHLGVQQNTAWLILHKIMSAMADREANRRLEANIEVDDAYIGGRLHDQKGGPGITEQGALRFGCREDTRRASPTGRGQCSGGLPQTGHRPLDENPCGTREAGLNPMACPVSARPAELGHDHRPVAVKGDRAS